MAQNDGVGLPESRDLVTDESLREEVAKRLERKRSARFEKQVEPRYDHLFWKSLAWLNENG